MRTVSSSPYLSEECCDEKCDAEEVRETLDIITNVSTNTVVIYRFFQG